MRVYRCSLGRRVCVSYITIIIMILFSFIYWSIFLHVNNVYSMEEDKPRFSLLLLYMHTHIVVQMMMMMMMMFIQTVY